MSDAGRAGASGQVGVVELLAAMRLASPALPIGAFAYSQGLEQACDRGWVHDRETADDWIGGVMAYGLARFDLPLLAQLHRALASGDEARFAELDAWVLAGRESAELRAEERHLGTALYRLLLDTGDETHERPTLQPASYVAAFALWCHRASIGEPVALAAYAGAWLEHQVSAAIRLVPLGQTDGHRVLAAQLEAVPGILTSASDLPPEEIGASLPGLAIASAWHETQYSRLFRS
jgi:urease accessory protein